MYLHLGSKGGSPVDQPVLNQIFEGKYQSLCHHEEHPLSVELTFECKYMVTWVWGPTSLSLVNRSWLSPRYLLGRIWTMETQQ